VASKAKFPPSVTPISQRISQKYQMAAEALFFINPKEKRQYCSVSLFLFSQSGYSSPSLTLPSTFWFCDELVSKPQYPKVDHKPVRCGASATSQTRNVTPKRMFVWQVKIMLELIVSSASYKSKAPSSSSEIEQSAVHPIGRKNDFHPPSDPTLWSLQYKRSYVVRVIFQRMLYLRITQRGMRRNWLPLHTMVAYRINLKKNTHTQEA
jgi:hypothetical protein